MIDQATAQDINQNFPDRKVGDPVAPCADTATKHIVRVVQWKSNDYARVAAAEPLSTTHELQKQSPPGITNWGALWNRKDVKKDEILATMAAVHKGDIFTSDTHGLMDKTSLKCIGIDSTNGFSSAIYLAELIAKIDKGNPPSVAIVFGCKTGELLKGIVTVGKIPVAFGITGGDTSIAGISSQTDNTRGADAATAALMTGQSITKARDAATALMTFSATYFGASVDWEMAPGIDFSKNLEDNGLV